ncbi:MAG TPA: hypothetical protein ENK60_02415 [Anaerolineae bacterium]|nr:hypothetical protein [Anaerolineae bacterium]
MITRLYQRLASPWMALAFTVPAVFLGARLMRGNASLPADAPTILHLQLAFTPQRFQAVLAAWDQAIIHEFLTTLWMDYLYAASYGLALASWLAWLSRKGNQPPSRGALTLFALPLIAGLADWLENTLHFFMIAIHHNASAHLVFLASLAASIKWLAILLSFLALLALLLRRWTAAVRRGAT